MIPAMAGSNREAEVTNLAQVYAWLKYGEAGMAEEAAREQCLLGQYF